MEDFTVTFEVFSPRWGHSDPYTIKLSSEEMTISNGNFSAQCQLAENGDPNWSGYREEIGNPLMGIFSNDMIAVPSDIPFALEWAWEKFRNGTNRDVLNDGLAELFEWIDQTARNKPQTTLWRGAF